MSSFNALFYNAIASLPYDSAQHNQLPFEPATGKEVKSEVRAACNAVWADFELFLSTSAHSVSSGEAIATAARALLNLQSKKDTFQLQLRPWNVETPAAPQTTNTDNGGCSFYFVPVPEYGASMMFVEDADANEFSVQVVFPLLSDQPAASVQRQELFFVDNQADGSFPLRWNVSKSATAFMGSLQTIITHGSSMTTGAAKGAEASKKYHHTPAWLHAAIECLPKFPKPESVFSPGGAVDVGNHTGTRTPFLAWPVVRAAISHFARTHCGATERCMHKLFLLFRAFVLQRAMDTCTIRSADDALGAVRLLVREVELFFGDADTPMNAAEPLALIDLTLVRAHDWIRAAFPMRHYSPPATLPPLDPLATIEMALPAEWQAGHRKTTVKSSDPMTSGGGLVVRLPTQCFFEISDSALLALSHLLGSVWPLQDGFSLESLWAITEAERLVFGTLSKPQKCWELSKTTGTVRTMSCILGVVKDYNRLCAKTGRPVPIQKSHRKLFAASMACIAFEIAPRARDARIVNAYASYCVPLKACQIAQLRGLFCTTNWALYSVLDVLKEYAEHNERQRKVPLFALAADSNGPAAELTALANAYASADASVLKLANQAVSDDAAAIEFKLTEWQSLMHQREALLKQKEAQEQAARSTRRGGNFGRRDTSEVDPTEIELRELEGRTISVATLRISRKHDPNGFVFAFCKHIQRDDVAERWLVDILGICQRELDVRPLTQRTGRSNFFQPRPSRLFGPFQLEHYNNKPVAMWWLQTGDCLYSEPNAPIIVDALQKSNRNWNEYIVQSLDQADFTMTVQFKSMQYMMQWPLEAGPTRQNRPYAEAAGNLPPNLSPSEYIDLGSVRACRTAQIFQLCNVLRSHQSFDLQPGSVGFSILLQTLIHCQAWIDASSFTDTVEMSRFFKVMSRAFSKAPDVPHMALLLLMLAMCPTTLRDEDPDAQNVWPEGRALRNQLASFALEIVDSIGSNYLAGAGDGSRDDGGDGAAAATASLAARKERSQQQLFVCAVGLLAFHNRAVDPTDVESLQLYARLLVLWRHKLSMAAGSIEAPTAVNKWASMHSAVEAFAHEAVLGMLPTMSSAVEREPSILNIAVAEIDETIRDREEGGARPWRWGKISMKNSEFVVATVGEDLRYRVDLLTGSVLKNGEQLQGLPQSVLGSPLYRALFGVADFEVTKTDAGSYRTLHDLRALLFPKWALRFRVYFDFTADSIKLLMVDVGDAATEISWTLCGNSTIGAAKDSRHEYFAQFFEWISDGETAPLMSLLTGQSMSTVQQISFFGIADETPEAGGRRASFSVYVVPQDLKECDPAFIAASVSNGMLDTLCRQPSQRSAQQWTVGMEHPQLQLVLKCVDPHDGGAPAKTSIWLPRLDLYFDVLYERSGEDTQVLLQPRWRSDYVVSQNVTLQIESAFCVNDRDEGSSFSRALVLQKRLKTFSPLSQLQHQVIVCLADTFGKRDTIGSPCSRLKMREYSLHDHYWDLRPQNREDALFLAAEYACSSKACLPLPHLEQTPMDLAVRLIRKSYSNVPLTEDEACHIVRACQSKHATATLKLCCHILWQLSKAMPWCAWKDEVAGDANLLSEREVTIAHTAYLGAARYGGLSQRQSLTAKEAAFLGIPEGVWGSNVEPLRTDDVVVSFVSEVDALIDREVELINILSLRQQALDPSQFPYDKYPSTPVAVAPPKPPAPGIAASARPSSHSESELQREFIADLRRSWKCVSLNQFTDTKDPQELITLLSAASVLGNDAHKLRASIWRFLSQCYARALSLSSVYKRRNCAYLTSRLTPADFTQCICSAETTLLPLFPCSTGRALGCVQMCVHQYNILSSLIDKTRRILSFIQGNRKSEVNLKGLLRDLTSPRRRIIDNTAMVSLEAELKIQIWKSQLDTFELLSTPGLVVQLNMGEGKTQVILPLLVLQTLLAQHRTPQIMVLSALLSEAFLNYERTLTFSGFSFPILQRPFNRDCNVEPRFRGQFDRVLEFFGGKAVLLLTREHYASLLLKCKTELKGAIAWQSRFPVSTFLDEVDELLSTNFRLVYSVGASVPLPHADVRSDAIHAVLMVVSQLLPAWLDCGIATLSSGGAGTVNDDAADVFPDFHLLPDDEWPNNFTQAEFVAQLLQEIMERSKEFRFLRGHIDAAREFICDPLKDEEQARARCGKLLANERLGPHVYLLRGLLAHGVLKHCLQQRFNVKYGKPLPQHVKRVAVPFLAANVPHPRSEFSHPDVSMTLTYITYFREGLTRRQFREAVDKLLGLSASAQEAEYQLWIAHRPRVQEAVSKASGIDVTSGPQVAFLYDQLANANVCSHEQNSVSHVSPAVIGFWLTRCVFPNDLKQFPQFMTASASDLTFGGECVGFSGTKDNRWLLPVTVKEVEHKNAAIEATDGEVLYMFMRHTKDIVALTIASTDEAAAQPMWRTLLLHAINRRAAALIDVGALLVGAEALDMVEWLVEQPQFQAASRPGGGRFRGVSFFYRGKWAVFSCALRRIVEARQQILDDETFVIYDEARCRGADRFLHPKALAFVTISPGLTKDRLMQAFGRLRKLGNNQEVIIGCEERVLQCAAIELEPSAADNNWDEIVGRSVKDRDDAIIKLLHWVKRNTIAFVEHSLLNFAELAVLHANPAVQRLSVDLRALYARSRREVPLHDALPWSRVGADEGKVALPTVPHKLIEHMARYGKGVAVMRNHLEGQCEREAEAEEEQEQQEERQVVSLTPLPFDEAQAKKNIVISAKCSDRPPPLHLQNLVPIAAMCPMWDHPITRDFILVTHNFMNVVNKGPISVIRNVEFVFLCENSICAFHPLELDILVDAGWADSLICTGRFSHSSAEEVDCSELVDEPRLGLALAFLHLFCGRCTVPPALAPFMRQLLSDLLISELHNNPESRPDAAKYVRFFLDRHHRTGDLRRSELEMLCIEVDRAIEAERVAEQTSTHARSLRRLFDPRQ